MWGGDACVALANWSHRDACVALASWSHRDACVALASWSRRGACVALANWSHRDACVALANSAREKETHRCQTIYKTSRLLGAALWAYVLPIMPLHLCNILPF